MNVKYDPQNSVNFAFFIIMKALLLSLVSQPKIDGKTVFPL